VIYKYKEYKENNNSSGKLLRDINGKFRGWRLSFRIKLKLNNNNKQFHSMTKLKLDP